MYYFLEEKIWVKERYMGGVSGADEWWVWGYRLIQFICWAEHVAMMFVTRYLFKILAEKIHEK
jgi:hypothetical protein